MGIILKFIFKSIGEKKLRTFLILLAITLSSGVFFASMSISGSLSKMILDMVKSSVGNADILISAGPKSPSSTFYSNGAEKYADELEYIVGQVGGNAIYTHNIQEEVTVSLKGINIDDLQKMNPFVIEEQSNLYPFNGRKIVINKSAADRYQLKLGESITLKFNNSSQRFVICAIAATGGPFADDGQSIAAAVPKDVLGAIYNIKGKNNLLYIKLKDPLKIQEMIQKLSVEYKNYRVAEPIPLDELKKETSSISVVFMMLSCIVFFMSIFIIYSSFKVITAERLPAIGTFRSMGATKRMTNRILLGESLVYGLVGGILGSLIGVGILYILSQALSQMAKVGPGMKMNAALQLSPLNFIISILMATVLCFISSIVPIIRVSRISVKDIVLNVMKKPTKQKIGKLIAGICLMAAALACSLPESDNLRPLFGSAGMLLSLIALIFLVPYLTSLLAGAFERLYILIFGNIGILAAKNLRENRNIFNNISMLAIGISSLLLFNTAGYDSVVSINDTFKDVRYDIEMYTGRADRNTVRMLLGVDGVSAVYGNFETYDIEVPGNPEKIRRIKGVDKSNFLNFWNLNAKEDAEKLLTDLDEGRNIILTTTLQKRYGVNKGDFITLKMKSGEMNYKVVGFIEDFLTSTNCALVSERFLKSDMQTKYYNGLYIKTNKNPNEVADAVKAEFRRWRPYITTIEQRIQDRLQNTKQSMTLMMGFSVLAMVIGIFGIINNLLISFIERKQSFAVFRSMGMSKVQTIKMIFIESLTGGFIGGIMGVLGAILMITILAGTNEASKIHYPIPYFFGYMAAGAIIMLIASISPAIKSSKLDIVSTIKFE